MLAEAVCSTNKEGRGMSRGRPLLIAFGAFCLGVATGVYALIAVGEWGNHAIVETDARHCIVNPPRRDWFWPPAGCPQGTMRKCLAEE
jgi:hypothetical protein